MSTVPDAEGLREALRALGVAGVVRADARLAVLVPDDAALDVRDPALRRRLLETARAHGFTHLALEVDDDDAALRGG